MLTHRHRDSIRMPNGKATRTGIHTIDMVQPFAKSTTVLRPKDPNVPSNHRNPTRTTSCRIASLTRWRNNAGKPKPKQQHPTTANPIRIRTILLLLLRTHTGIRAILPFRLRDLSIITNEWSESIERWQQLLDAIQSGDCCNFEEREMHATITAKNKPKKPR